MPLSNRQFRIVRAAGLVVKVLFVLIAFPVVVFAWVMSVAYDDRMTLPEFIEDTFNL